MGVCFLEFWVDEIRLFLLLLMNEIFMIQYYFAR